jgi:hypothetical protein
MARNATDEGWGYLDQRHYALHDRDAKFCALVRATLAAGGIQPIQVPGTKPELECICRLLGEVGEIKQLPSRRVYP